MSASYHFYNAMNSASTKFEKDIAHGLRELADEIDKMKRELDTIKSRISR